MHTITKKEKLPGSLLLIEGEISAEAIKAERTKALEKFQQMFAIDGFRKGHIPEKVLAEKVGELGITEEAGSLALEKNYAAIIKEVGISPIGQPQVSITKIAPDQAMGFKIEVAVVPEVSLPDYKKIAKASSKKSEEVEVADTELEEAIKDIRASVAHHQFHQEHGDTHDHNHNFKDEELPELTDELVKTLGQFDNVEDFKTKLKQNLVLEKQQKAREKNRLDIIEAIIKETKVDVPEVLIESELLKMLGQFKDSISSMGMSFDEYLTKISKTEDDLRAEWKDEAKKRATIELILNEISVKEKLVAGEEEIKQQTEQLLTYYKDADPVRIRVYVETMLINEKVWRFLEEQN
jgi:trigger factor